MIRELPAGYGRYPHGTRPAQVDGGPAAHGCADLDAHDPHADDVPAVQLLDDDDRLDAMHNDFLDRDGLDLMSEFRDVALAPKTGGQRVGALLAWFERWRPAYVAFDREARERGRV